MRVYRKELGKWSPFARPRPYGPVPFCSANGPKLVPFYFAEPILKSNTRIAAFGYVALMAYLVYALVQRAIRSALPEGETLEIEGRKTDRPTAQAVFDVMRNAKVLHVQLPDHGRRRVLLTPSARITRVLQLLRIPVDALATAPTAWLNPG